MKRTKKKQRLWPWHLLTLAILLMLGWGLWFSTSLIAYEWRWNRIPQYFIYHAETIQRAAEDGSVTHIETHANNSAEVTLTYYDGQQQIFKIAADSLHLNQGDDISEGDEVGIDRHLALGPLLSGLLTTLWIAIFSAIVALIIGLIAGLARLSKNPTLRDLTTIYIELVRGTPLLVQIFIFYFFVGTVLNFSREFAAVAALGLFTGAYVGEIIRAGIQSIAKGQDEAARSLGLSSVQSMRHVILPQAFRCVLPPLAGQFITLVKDTSLISAIAITELTKSGREAITSSFSTFEIWFCVAGLYLLINLPLSQLTNYLERKLAKHD